MKKNPGRKRLREMTRAHTRKHGDLNRKSQHIMRTKMGMSSGKEESSGNLPQETIQEDSKDSQ